MQKDLTSYRKSYEKGQLRETDLPSEPWELFNSWFHLADDSEEIEEANAMNLTTVGNGMVPKTRVVLLKSFSKEGLVFFSNYTSSKARDIGENPHCCLSFFWPPLEKQVIIQGKVEKLTEEESNDYFQARPRGSQLGAHASPQSSEIPTREYLEKRLEELEKKYANSPVPKPENWGGYRVKPINFEFWQGREKRLHDRILYFREQGKWKFKRLAP